MCHTTDDIIAITGRTRQHINRVCRQLFGAGGWRRTLSDEEYQRVLKVFQQPGRKKMFSNLNNGDNLRHT